MVQIFIGTACDRSFVDFTCAMLSSVDERGMVPEATVVIGAFNLANSDCEKLRLSAGRLGRKMRFLPVPRKSPLIPVVPKFEFPFHVLGCLVLPKAVDVSAARMVILDSDMIVNSSLRPLFEIDLRGHPIAAVENMLVESDLRVRERQPDFDYFNTGLLVVDIDMWNARDLGDRAMRWLAEQNAASIWPDQDALNHVVQGNWLHLDRGWNFAGAGQDRQFTYEEYCAAQIVHFSGAKPIETRDHPAVSLYDRQVNRIAQRAGWSNPDSHSVDRDFVASSYEVLLGRQVESVAAIMPRLGHTPSAVIQGFLSSSEFQQVVLTPLTEGTDLDVRRWSGKPSLRQRYWAADRLPILASTAENLLEAKSWRDMLSLLIKDDRLVGLMSQSV